MKTIRYMVSLASPGKEIRFSSKGDISRFSSEGDSFLLERRLSTATSSKRGQQCTRPVHARSMMHKCACLLFFQCSKESGPHPHHRLHSKAIQEIPGKCLCGEQASSYCSHSRHSPHLCMSRNRRVENRPGRDAGRDAASV